MNDILEEDEGGLSGFTILAILTTLIVVFVLVVFYAYKQGMARASSFSEELPVIASDPTPVAEDVPLDVARSDREEVYDRINGTVPTRTVTYEEPSRDALNGYGSAPAKLAQREQAATEPSVDDPAVTAMTEEAKPVAERTAPPPMQKPATVAERTTPTPVRTADAATTTAAKPAAAQSSGPSAVAGSHVVQVGAFDSNAAAMDYFDGLATRMGTLVSNKKPDIQVAEVKGRTYHRLRIGPFSSKSTATDYCSQLKARGQDCLVRGV